MNLQQLLNAMRAGTLLTARRFRGPTAKARTVPESLHSLAEAISLILEDRREDALRGLPAEAIHEVVVVQ